ncbi:MAG: hypothetical protein JWR58_566 [Pseudonocardia sp.]|nr:hypothetical protein [Pseudonocardia sp.]
MSRVVPLTNDCHHAVGARKSAVTVTCRFATDKRLSMITLSNSD